MSWFTVLGAKVKIKHTIAFIKKKKIQIKNQIGVSTYAGSVTCCL